VSPVTTASTVLPPTPAPTWAVSPGAKGNCLPANPCGDIAAAVRRAQSGQVIAVAAGHYPAVKIANFSAAGGWSANVIVLGPPDGVAQIDGAFTVEAPHITLRHLVIRGDVTAPGSARWFRIEASNVSGGTILDGASDSAVLNNEISGNVDADGINVKDGAARVVVEGDYVHDLVTGPKKVHVDCLQMFGASDVLITRVVFTRCSNVAVQLQITPRFRTDRIRIENSFLQGCRAPSASCPYGFAVTAVADDPSSAPGSDWTFISNTIDGPTNFKPPPGFLLRNDVFTFLGQCIDGDHNYVVAYNKGVCKSPSFLSPTTRVGPMPPFVDRAAGDLHVRLGPVDLAYGNPDANPTTDIDGRRRGLPPSVGGAEVVP
jgi:hypothetical protein